MAPSTTHANGASAGSQLSANTIRVRMYRVGFGDCFLVSLPLVKPSADGTTHKHILVDCGVHNQGNIDTIKSAVENIAEVTGGTLALVIATHSHQDHISGFNREWFKDFDVKEVWLPWVEAPGDPIAMRFRAKEQEMATRLLSHFDAAERRGLAPTDPDLKSKREAARQALVNILGASDVLAAGNGHAKLTTNAKAMELLRSGFNGKAKVEYVKAGEKRVAPGKIKGLTVEVLGPPRDKKSLSKMNPPSGQGYLRLDESGQVVEDTIRPFADKWIVKRSATHLKSIVLPKETEKALQKELVYSSVDSLAFSIDQVKNNTSIVALLSFRGEYLLFPGDAQYGNWRAWLDRDDAGDILKRITFLKVAHHGSHNATPKDALEHMNQHGFAAMVSTQTKPWDVIPRRPLMKRLDEMTGRRTVRSDSLRLKNAPLGPKLAALPDGFEKGDLWFDYLIEV